MNRTSWNYHTPPVTKAAVKKPSSLPLLSLTVGAFAIGMTEFVIMGILPNVAEDLNVSVSAAASSLRCMRSASLSARRS